LLALAPLQNVFVKCSGANMFSRGAARTPQQVGRQYNTLLNLFGAERCFFGGNFPVGKIKLGYGALIATGKAAVAHRRPAEQRAFFHDTAARFYCL